MDDILKFYFDVELIIPGWILFVWFIVAFGIANFRVFEGFQSSKVEFQPKNNSVTLLGNWLNLNQGGNLVVTENLNVSFTMVVGIFNPLDHPTSVKLGISSIESDWQASIDPTNVKFQFDTNRHHETDELKLTGLEGKDIRVTFKVAFRGSDNTSVFQYLGSLSKMIVHLTIEQKNYKERSLTIPFDVSGIRQTIENQLLEQGIRLVVKSHDSRVAISYVLEKEQIPILLSILKKYWNIDGK